MSLKSNSKNVAHWPRRIIGTVVAASLLWAVPLVDADDGVPSIVQDLPAAQAEKVFVKIEEARRLMAAGDHAQAQDLLERAQQRQPNNVAVAHLLQRIKGIRSGLEGESEARVEDQAVVDLAHVEVRVLLSRAEAALRQEDYDQAETLLGAARSHMERFPWQQGQEYLEHIEALLAETMSQREHSDEHGARQKRQDALDQALRQREQVVAEERSVYQERLRRIVAVQQRGHYELALAQARQLVSDYPDAASAEALFQRLVERVFEQRKLSLAERERAVRQELHERIHRAMIPEGFDGRPLFPDDWRRRQERTSTVAMDAQEVPEWQERLLDRMAQRLSVEFSDVDPIEVVEFVANRAGINVVIASDLRLAAHAPVSLQVSNMRVENLFNWVCRAMGTRWILRGGAVFIGDGREDDTELRIYDITEALFAPPDMPGPRVAGNRMATAGAAGGGGGGTGGFDLFRGAGVDDGDGLMPEDLMDLIREAVSPQAWDDPDVNMEVRNRTQLLITAPPALHTMVQEFLRSQMAVNRTMVHTRMRWLEIRDTMVEEIGVNWRSGGDGAMLRPFSSGTAGIRRNYSTGSAAAGIINRLPGTALSMSQEAASSGLQLHAALLGSTQLSAIFTATRQNERGRSVSGIDLTTMHGQRAHALFLSQVSYITDYNVETGGDGNGVVEPVLGTAPVGSVLDVRPYVSADRKYVTMDLRPLHTSLSFTVERFSVITTIGDTFAVLSFPLELPNLRTHTAGTRVMIPDGGSILVGGFSEAVDQHAYSTVPVVGHVPFIGRLFGKRGRFQENTRLFLLVSVDIILYDEEEAYL
ncbi:MAG: hypothetical protein EA401_10105 [Planctomycetota bacterium]|nr:MAG: hypothetical protein EA401_10105 [Planctomycetota bacterium]